jgi:hypothetical protein
MVQRCLSVEELVEAESRVSVFGLRFGTSPVRQKEAAVVLSQNRELVEEAVGVGDHGLEKSREVPTHPPDRLRVEQISAVSESSEKAVLRLL